jgi:SAM-dependent methyltransferase
VLEIGAGEGALAVRLASAYTYTGIEPDARAREKAGRRLARLAQGELVLRDLSEVDPGKRFDLVCAFEVLEHIEDDEAALREWRGLLAPSGMLLLTVPAGRRRFGPADALVGHCRRYEEESLRDLLEKVGFRIVRLECFGFPLGYLLETLRHIAASRGLQDPDAAERSRRSGRWLQPPEQLAFATRFVTAPFRALDRVLPPETPGTSLVALASRS